MNYEYLKKKMDRFFNSTPVEKLMSDLEKLGYGFVDSNSEVKNDENTVIYSTINEIPTLPSMPYKLNGDCSYVEAA